MLRTESQRLCNVWHAKLLLLSEWASVIAMLSYMNCDITGLVKNFSALFLCVRSVSFSTSISRSHYHCRRRTCNLTVISSPRKSSNHPFWSMMRIVRSVDPSCDNRQVNDLRRPLRYLISWRYARRKFVSCARFYRCCTRPQSRYILRG